MPKGLGMARTVDPREAEAKRQSKVEEERRRQVEKEQKRQEKARKEDEKRAKKNNEKQRKTEERQHQGQTGRSTISRIFHPGRTDQIAAAQSRQSLQEEVITTPALGLQEHLTKTSLVGRDVQGDENTHLGMSSSSTYPRPQTDSVNQPSSRFGNSLVLYTPPRKPLPAQKQMIENQNSHIENLDFGSNHFGVEATTEINATRDLEDLRAWIKVVRNQAPALKGDDRFKDPRDVPTTIKQLFTYILQDHDQRYTNLEEELSKEKYTHGNTQELVEALEGKLKKVQTELDSLRLAMELTLAQTKSVLNEQHEKEMRKGLEETEQLKGQLGQWTDHAQQQESYIQQLRTSYQKDLEHAQDEIARASSSYETHLSGIKMSHENEKGNLKGQHATETRRLTIEHSQALSSMRAAKDRLEEKYKQEMAKGQQKHENELSQLKGQMNELESTKSNEIVAIRSSTERQIAQATQTTREDLAQGKRLLQAHEENFGKELAAEKSRLENEYQVKTITLRKDNESFRRALVSRDQFKGLTDRDISSRFIQLANEVDDVSRVPWHVEKEGQWPYNARFLNSSKNPRKLKHHILQSGIWSILWKRMFWTPFQPFGEEGDDLQRKWTTEYGQDQSGVVYSHWPEATEKSEEWRYKAVKEYQDAVDMRGEETQLSRQRREVYEKNSNMTADEIAHSIEKTAYLNADVLIIISNIVKMAAKLWLEFGCQRYRVVILFPVSLSRPSGKELANEARDLVVRPEVRRIGNAQGTELDEKETVKGCERELSTYLPY